MRGELNVRISATLCRKEDFYVTSITCVSNPDPSEAHAVYVLDAGLSKGKIRSLELIPYMASLEISPSQLMLWILMSISLDSNHHALYRRTGLHASNFSGTMIILLFGIVGDLAVCSWGDVDRQSWQREEVR